MSIPVIKMVQRRSSGERMSLMARNEWEMVYSTEHWTEANHGLLFAYNAEFEPLYVAGSPCFDQEIWLAEAEGVKPIHKWSGTLDQRRWLSWWAAYPQPKQYDKVFGKEEVYCKRIRLKERLYHAKRCSVYPG